MTNQARALLVDDDSSWQQILREILEDMDLTVDSATSFASAVKVTGEPHRIAIVDLCLVESDHHNQDGIRVVDAIKSRDPDCVILMLTGHATVELAVSVLTEHGVSNCLRKEVFQRAEFKRLIQRSLEAAPIKVGQSEAEISHHQIEAGDDIRKLASTARNHEVLIVEDDAGWRGILNELLIETGFQVRVATSFGEALGCLRRGRYAMAIVDLSLAGPAEDRITRVGSEEDLANLEGYRLLATIQSGGIPVIVLSGLSDPERIEKAYNERRIFAYIEKQSFDRRVFLQTIADISSQKDIPNDLDVLTEREQEVLELVAQGKTNKEIAELLVITTNTVKRHLKAVFAKLDIHTRSAAAAKIASLDK
jgi:DNA-binding NarL/FixJ family response regulator